MHPMIVNDEELALMKEAKDKKDWKLLPTWKLRYLYQRLVALPSKDLKSVKVIAKKARGKNIESCKVEANMIKYNSSDLPF